MNIVTIGGNALIPTNGRGTIEEQIVVATEAMAGVADMIDAGERVIQRREQTDDLEVGLLLQGVQRPRAVLPRAPGEQYPGRAHALASCSRAASLPVRSNPHSSGLPSQHSVVRNSTRPRMPPTATA